MAGVNFNSTLNALTRDGQLSKTDLTKLKELANDGQGDDAQEQWIVKQLEKNDHCSFNKGTQLGSSSTSFNFVVALDTTFHDKFGELAKDGVIDKNDISVLESMAKTDSEKKIVKGLKSSDANNLEYSLQAINFSDYKAAEKGKNRNFKFILSPNMNEKDEVPTKGNFKTSTENIVSHTSQSDLLKKTKTDSDRCGAGATVNALLLTKGEQGFKDLAEKLIKEGKIKKSDIDRDAEGKIKTTYNNIHRVQDALMGKFDAKKDGLNVKFDRKTLISTGKSEIDKAIDYAGLTRTGIPKQDREEKIKEFFTNNPDGAIVINIDGGDKNNSYETLGFDKNSKNDHWVTVVKKGDKYYVADTGNTAINGDGKHYRELTDQEVQALVYNNPRTMIGVANKEPLKTNQVNPSMNLPRFHAGLKDMR